MSITSILNIAKNAMSATQTAVNVTSHNISNVNTKGYSRQQAIFDEAPPIPTDIGLMGDGVRIKGISRNCDQFLEDLIAGKNTSLEEQATVEKYFTRIESVLNENNSRLSASITDFFNGWQELSADPTSVPIRTNIVVKSENLSRSIRNIYSELKGLQTELDKDLEREVQDANRIISSIADLNKKVYEGGIGSGETNDFLDQRAVLFKELSGKLDLVSIQDSYGRLTVLTAKGKVLVDGGRSWNLGTVQDEATGFKRVAWVDAAGNASDIAEDIGGGKLKALMDMRDGELENVFLKNMDDLAESVIKEVNAVHKGGVNLNGTTDIPFFEEIDTGYAKGMALSSSIKRDLKNIASTSSSVNSTDNDIAMGIASLGETNVTIGGSQMTFTNYVSSIMTNIGEMAANAKDRSQYDQDTMEIMEKQRESLSGVSLDEEMADLIKFQYAYQAAARLFTVADELFKTLLEAV